MGMDDLPRTPEGYERLPSTEVYLKDDELIILGDPPSNEDEEAGHNCDYMGCGVQHVICRAIVAIGRTDGKKTKVERLESRIKKLESKLSAAQKLKSLLKWAVSEIIYLEPPPAKGHSCSNPDDPCDADCVNRFNRSEWLLNCRKAIKGFGYKQKEN